MSISIEQVKELSEYYSRYLKEDIPLEDGYYKFGKNSIMKTELELILSEIPEIINTLKEKLEANEVLKKDLEEKLEANEILRKDLESSREVNRELSKANKNLVKELSRLRNNQLDSNPDKTFIDNFEIKNRLDNHAARLVEIENWIKQGHNHYISINGETHS